MHYVDALDKRRKLASSYVKFLIESGAAGNEQNPKVVAMEALIADIDREIGNQVGGAP